MTDLPHFALPFRFTAPNTAVNEQDTLDDIADCVTAVLLCPVGFRVELPEFGLPDPTFSQVIDTDEIREVIDTWEPRATVVLDETPDLFDALIAHVGLQVQVRTED